MAFRRCTFTEIILMDQLDPRDSAALGCIHASQNRTDIWLWPEFHYKSFYSLNEKPWHIHVHKNHGIYKYVKTQFKHEVYVLQIPRAHIHVKIGRVRKPLLSKLSSLFSKAAYGLGAIPGIQVHLILILKESFAVRLRRRAIIFSCLSWS